MLRGAGADWSDRGLQLFCDNERFEMSALEKSGKIFLITILGIEHIFNQIHLEVPTVRVS